MNIILYQYININNIYSLYNRSVGAGGRELWTIATSTHKTTDATSLVKGVVIVIIIYYIN